MAEETAPITLPTRAAGYLPPWTVGELPFPPSAGWRLWIGLIGPGIVLAGTSIGSGEWLFGPAVSAQYGATLLWLALLSIVFQVFCNLMMMRYAVYCGEPIVVGGLRTWPGPALWIAMYAVLDLAAIWPYNASNAAVPLAAAWLGRLPTGDDQSLVRGLGFALFLLSFVPLIFGGTVYRMLERIMTFKLVAVLSYLTFVALFMVSTAVVFEVLGGFFSFGAVPIRAETVVAGRHFTIAKQVGDRRCVARGSFERANPAKAGGGAIATGAAKTENASTAAALAEFRVIRGTVTTTYKTAADVPADLAGILAAMLEEARPYAEANRFLVAARDGDTLFSAAGRIEADGSWRPDQATVTTGGAADGNGAADGSGAADGNGAASDTAAGEATRGEATRGEAAAGEATRSYATLDEVPTPHGPRLRNLVEHRGFERVSLPGYVAEHGRLPPLDWAMLASFCAIAGAGGLSNTLFSNYARDKGWGMGRAVGAIPSAVGGMTIRLSHSGQVFDETSPEQQRRWRGWIAHIVRDQVIVWLACSVLGMALPCMLSLEFIRNATVGEHRVAAMIADGMAARYPAYGGLFWLLTLLCGFLILAPGQVSVGDQIARRWTDIIWTASPWARRMRESRVGQLYYGILAGYCVWGLIALWLFPPLAIAKIGAVLGNVALGCATLHALYANRVLLPPSLRPRWFLQAGTAVCAVFFFGLTAIVVWHMI